jgi:radical SAM superfamily enzyme YgiQ (UPF0313 family)
MKKLTLVNTKPSIYPPLGLGYIAAYLIKYLNFNNIEIIESDTDVFSKISKSKPDIVGFTSVSPTYSQVSQISREVKKNLEIPTIIGGSHITAIPYRLSQDFDVAVYGEGEITVLELMKAFLEKESLDSKYLQDIDGIAYHNNSKVEVTKPRKLIEPLDTIPPPARELFDMNRYLQPSDALTSGELMRGTTLLTSRGCPYNCRFCQVTKNWKKPRFHSPQYIIDEIKYLVDTYKIEGLNIIDDLFIANKRRLGDFVNLLSKEGLDQKLRFTVNGRANLINEDIMLLLKKMNVELIALGLESMSEPVLDYLKNNTVTVEQNKAAVNLINKYGMKVSGLFMIGTPGETKEDMMKTLNYIKKTRWGHCHISITTPLPGTELWELAKKRGLVDEYNINWDAFNAEPLSDPTKNFYMCENVPQKEFINIYKEFRKECDRVNIGNIATNSFSEILTLENAKGAFLHPVTALKIILNLTIKKLDNGENGVNDLYLTNEIKMGATDRYSIGYGWYPLENFPHPGRWTKSKAIFYLKPIRCDIPSILKIELLTFPEATKKPCKGKVIVNGKKVHDVYFEKNGWHELEIKLNSPIDRVIKGEILIKSVWVPDRYLKNGDKRSLGIAVKNISINPVDG